jgi:hypothetical protein
MTPLRLPNPPTLIIATILNQAAAAAYKTPARLGICLAEAGRVATSQRNGKTVSSPHGFNDLQSDSDK